MLRIGMIGAGWVAEQHLAALKQIPEVQVVAVYNPTRSKAEALAAQAGGEVCDSPSEVIQKSDVVYALAPQDMRVAYVMEAARAGKHIFVEKPLALTLSEADRQVEAVERAGVKVQMGFVMRKFANFQKLNEIYASGELGELATVWTQRMWFRDFAPDYYQASMSRSGGLTNELNVHDFDWLRTVGGEVRSVYGCVVRTRTDRDVEDNSYSLLNFDTGFGLVGTSWLAAIPYTSAGIVGSKGMALLRGDEVIKKRIDADEEEVFHFDSDRLMADAYLAQEKEFIACVLGDQQPSASIYDGRKATAIALAVLESAQKNQVVQVVE